MATTNITMRIDEDLKKQLQELVSNLGMDMTTFFTISAKQACFAPAVLQFCIQATMIRRPSGASRV